MRRAQEIFDWLRNLDDSHDLYSLCTTMTYTTMISQAGPITSHVLDLLHLHFIFIECPYVVVSQGSAPVE